MPFVPALRQLANSLPAPARLLWTQIEVIAGHQRRSVPAAIRADASITKQQRQVLIDVYESFRRQGSPQAHSGGARLANAHADPEQEGGVRDSSRHPS